MAANKTEVAEKKDNLPAAYDYGDYSGQGYEGTDSGDIVIPFIGVLQALSPQLEDRDDCKAGMLINTVTEEVIDGKEGVTFVPAAVGLKEYVEWIPREKGGGLVSRHDYDSPFVMAAVEQAKSEGIPMGRNGRPLAPMKVKDGEGGFNDLIETKYIYGVLVDGETPIGPVCISFTSTKMKAFNSFYTRLSTVRGNPPPFAFLTKLTSIPDKNKKGSFHNFSLTGAVNGSMIDSLLPPTDLRFQAAAELYKMVKEGIAKPDFESQAATGGEGSEGVGPNGEPF